MSFAEGSNWTWQPACVQIGLYATNCPLSKWMSNTGPKVGSLTVIDWFGGMFVAFARSLPVGATGLDRLAGV